MSKNITNIKKEVPVKAEPHSFFQEMEERKLCVKCMRAQQ